LLAHHRSRSGEVETSRAEQDLRALEGYLVGNQDLERLEALLDHFNIFEAPGWCWGWLRGQVDAEEYRPPRRIKQDGEPYQQQEKWSEG
jgi:hypothetical protein